MAVTTGDTGTVTLVNGYVANVRNWTLNIVADEHDITDFSSTTAWTEYMTGLKRWSGSYECFLDDTTVLVLPGYGTGGGGAAMVLTSSTGRTFSGDAVVTAADVTVNPADPNVCTVNFRGTGALTVA
ncbi:hypothetical protein CMI37_35805 [Candidatus Pacearchaeota archaeon]|nr:hypothetical protein [Candidatus Pacearchaeota archaeon]|tara:strand:+ start:748 stop:1128 length:381 start_codon:yes stop_codon:yes gene_type:complete